MSAQRRKMITSRPACSASDFIARCGVEAESHDAKVALAVREILAELAGVQPEMIYPEDTYQRDLYGLGTLDSLDQVDFIMRLEARLGIRLSDRMAERLRGISDHELYNPAFTVRDTVLELTKSLSEMKVSTNSGK